MPIPGDPLPISPALWTDTKTGRPTDQFYRYIFKLDDFVATNIAALTAPAAAAPFALLNTLTASASVSLDDTSSISATYDFYMIELIDLIPAVNQDGLVLQYQVSAAFQTTGYLTQITGSDVNVFRAENRTDSIQLASTGSSFFGPLNTGAGVGGVIFLHAPNGTTNNKKVNGVTGWHSSSPDWATAIVGGVYNGSTAKVTGLRFKFLTGNTTSGKVKIYGIKT